MKEAKLLTKEKRHEIDVAVDRLMRIKRIRAKKKLVGWLTNHKN